MSTVANRFGVDPIAPASTFFPLAKPHNVSAGAARSVRPWGLRGMTPCQAPSKPMPEWRFDHERQIAVDEDGHPFYEVRMDPTAHSVSTNDGDEGPSEDWINDFAPDFPGAPA